MAADQLPDPETPFGKSVRERLASERLIWFTTVGKNGTPQPNPVWFLHDGGDILIYNLNTAARLGHIENRPQVSLNFNAGADGDGIVVITGVARLAPDEPLLTEHEAYVAKYGEAMNQISGDHDSFAQQYSKAIRIEIGKVRGF
jgi:PPOX class probable F420-dependent enzyme